MANQSEVIKVVAFDPGITDGFASGLINTTIGFMEVAADQQKWTVGELYTWLQETKPDAVIHERFTYRNRSRKGLVLESRNKIGVIQLYCEQNPNVFAFAQMPADAKTYFTDKELKANGVYRVKMPHANDAMRHLLRWFVFGAGYKYNKKGYGPA